MADTSGFAHYPGLVVFSGGSPDRTKVDQRLIGMYDSNWPSDEHTFLLPAHITFDENEGNVSPLDLMTILQNAPNLKSWNGNGRTGETFALVGLISRGQLRLISNLPGIKFIWLLEDRNQWNYQWPNIQV